MNADGCVGYAVALAVSSAADAASRARFNLRLVPTTPQGMADLDDERDVLGNEPSSGLVSAGRLPGRHARIAPPPIGTAHSPAAELSPSTTTRPRPERRPRCKAG